MTLHVDHVYSSHGAANPLNELNTISAMTTHVCLKVIWRFLCFFLRAAVEHIRRLPSCRSFSAATLLEGICGRLPPLCVRRVILGSFSVILFLQSLEDHHEVAYDCSLDFPFAYFYILY